MANKEAVPFADLFEIPLRNGLTKPSAVRGAGTKMVNMKEVFAYRRINGHPMERVPMSVVEKSNSLLREGDLLFARQSLVLSGAGKCVLFIGDQEDVTFESHIIRCRLNPNIAEPAYYFYLFESKIGRDLIESIVEQVSAAGIRGTDLGRLRVPCPPLSEQKSISRILGGLDDKIELNRRMNETLEQITKTLFKSWFVDFDPVHAKVAGSQPVGIDKKTADLFPDSFVDSEMGKIPEGWRVGTISEIATNPRRGIQPGDITPGTPYIGLEHMPRRSIALGDWADSSIVGSGKTAFKKGEILFGKLRPYFHKVGLAPVDGVCSTDILVLSPISEKWHGPLLCIASSDELIQFTNLSSTGTKMPRTNWADIGSFKFAMPAPELANKFTEITSNLTNQIAHNLRESMTLASTRDALIPQLLATH